MSERVPFFSVIIPTYNRARTVAVAVRSVLEQTDGDFECFVVDDGSTDGTREALGRLKDARLRLILNPENRGQHFCRNRAIQQALGRFVTFLDSDDLYLPSRLAAFRQAIDSRQEAGFWFSNAFVFRDGVVLGLLFDFKREIPQGKVPGWYAVGDRYLPYVTSTVAIRREAFDAFGLFREDLKILEDTELYARMLAGGLEVGSIAQALSVRFLHEGQITRDYERDFEEAVIALKSGQAPADIFEMRRKEIALEVAGYLIKSGEPLRARRFLCAALGAAATHSARYWMSFLPVGVLSTARRISRACPRRQSDNFLNPEEFREVRVWMDAMDEGKK